MEKNTRPHLYLLVPCAVCIPLLAGCSSPPAFELEPATAPMPKKWVESVESVPYVGEDAMGAPQPSPSPSLSPTPPSAPPPPLSRDLPYGIPVPGKRGLVRSPWSEQGFVDVSGMPPGIEAKCPYSGKVFLVP